MVQLLCEAGADKYKVDNCCFTALMHASGEDDPEVVQLLLEAGADKDKVGESGLTPLMLASVAGHLEVVRLLCEAGADKDKANNSGLPQMTHESLEGHLESGLTPLMLASSEGHLEVARLLCEAGAEKDKVDDSGLTALMHASSRGRLKVVRLLRKATKAMKAKQPINTMLRAREATAAIAMAGVAPAAKRRRLRGKQPPPVSPEGFDPARGMRPRRVLPRLWWFESGGLHDHSSVCCDSVRQTLRP